MSPAQKFKYYFPAWTAAVKANGWHMENKTVVVDETRLTLEGRQVLTYARQRAINHQPSTINLDDLRHGDHILALGRDKSSAELSNPELDRVVNLFQLLADPDNLAARLKWDAYQRGEDPGAEKRIEWFIQHTAPEAYVRHIAHDKFGTAQWETLPLGQKRHLAMTLAARKKSKAQSPKSKVYRPAKPSVPSVPSVLSVPSEDPDWNV